jgi:hypothetical protein
VGSERECPQATDKSFTRVNYFAISPNGERVLWFADPDGGERGEWKEEAFVDGRVMNSP